MGFFRMDSVWGGVDSTPPAILTNFAPIELKFSQNIENHVRVTNQEKNFEKTKNSRNFRENTLILHNIRRPFKLALEMASVTQYSQFCIKTMSDD